MKKYSREDLVWQRASQAEKEELLNLGLTNRPKYIYLVKKLGRKYVA
ncbi:hypothetical protein [Streptococcus himalayensis]|nr:hypothetical protein [Streptococcus himalayensis]QBX25395.1 hypothetical protein Javan254_0040 [Streptococcus phage Javan254]